VRATNDACNGTLNEIQVAFRDAANALKVTPSMQALDVRIQGQIQEEESKLHTIERLVERN
jgi:hypothetical protein